MQVIAARERRKLRDVMEEVVALGLRTRRQKPAHATTSRADAEAWLAKWQALGQRPAALGSCRLRLLGTCIDYV